MQAARMVDESGRDALTLAALAQHFGVAQPSLYKHVDGLPDLHGRLAVVAARDLASSVRRAASGKAGADAVTAVATAYRDYAHDHPGCYDYLLRPRTGDPEHERASREILDVFADVLAGYGIEATDHVVDAVRFVRTVLHGFVSLEIAGGFAMARSVDTSFTATVRGLDHALLAWGEE